IEWLAPATQGKAARQLSIALQSVTRLNHVSEQQQPKNSDELGFNGGGSNGVAVAARPAAQSNAALLNMPSVIAVDTKTASSLESRFGTSSGKLFRVGHGEWISA